MAMGIVNIRFTSFECSLALMPPSFDSQSDLLIFFIFRLTNSSFVVIIKKIAVILCVYLIQFMKMQHFCPTLS